MEIALNGQGSYGATLNRSIITLILFSFLLTTLETEPSLQTDYSNLFLIAEFALAIIFALEYGLRVWVSSNQTGRAGLIERIKYGTSFPAMIDLAAFLPSLLTLGVSDTFLLRLLRLTKLIRLAKIGRYSTALRTIELAIINHWRELVVSVAISIGFLFVSATLLYLVEGNAQPEVFGSIPRALWWSVVTLTTVGYGDVYPITMFGKICAGLVAFVGVGTVALPAGILAAAFSDTYKRLSREEKDGIQIQKEL